MVENIDCAGLHNVLTNKKSFSLSLENDNFALISDKLKNAL